MRFKKRFQSFRRSFKRRRKFRRPKFSNRNAKIMGMSFPMVIMLGVAAYLFIKPVKSTINNLFSKK